MDNKEFTREEFDRFAAWWLSKQEHTKKIANALCNRGIYDVFISASDDSDELRIGYTYYRYADDNYPETDYFRINFLFDPNAIEKATMKRDEEKRLEALRREERNMKEKRERMERAKWDYEQLKKELESKE